MLWFNSLCGLILAIIIMATVVGIEFSIHSFLSPIRIIALTVVIFACGFVFGWLAWTENEVLYHNWLKKQSHHTKKQLTNDLKP
jgi:uncharacterized membrane protein YciS (DUF1049 family)